MLYRGVLPYTVGTSPPGTCISLVPVVPPYPYCTTPRVSRCTGTGIYWYRGPQGMQYQVVTTSTVPWGTPTPPSLPLSPAGYRGSSGHSLPVVVSTYQYPLGEYHPEGGVGTGIQGIWGYIDRVREGKESRTAIPPSPSVPPVPSRVLVFLRGPLPYQSTY